MNEQEAARIAETRSADCPIVEREAYQILINTGRVWLLPGHVGKRAMELIADGSVKQKGVKEARKKDA